MPHERKAGRSSADTRRVSAAARDTTGTGADVVRARSFAERRPVELEARYRVEGPPLWLRCRVVDISTRGAGLLLVDEMTDPLQTVVIELRSPGHGDRIVLEARVRHTSLVDGRRRIGVEFLEMGPLKEGALCELMARQADLHQHSWQPPLPGMHEPFGGPEATRVTTEWSR